MSYNQPEYAWYVVLVKPEARNSRILSAWEFKNDAKDDFDETTAIDKFKDLDIRVLSGRMLRQHGLDPDDDLNWLNLGDVFAGRNPGKPKKNSSAADHAVQTNIAEERLKLAAKKFDSASTRNGMIDSFAEFSAEFGVLTASLAGTGNWGDVEKARFEKWDKKFHAMKTRLKAVK